MACLKLSITDGNLKLFNLRALWPLVDPIVVDPIPQDDDKTREKKSRLQDTKIYRISLSKYSEGEDNTSRYSHFGVVVSHWVSDNWVSRFRNISRAHANGVVLSEKACFCLLCAFSTVPS